MDTQLLQTFVTVAETGSLSGAAERLGYVQSSVSEQIRRLERDLGVNLLTRTSTGVSLSAAGQRLLPDAQRVLAALEELRRATSAPARLRLGTVDTLAVQWLPEILAALPPDRRPTITMNRRDLLLGELIDGRLDVVILYRPAGAPLPHVGAGVQATVNRLAVEVLDHDRLLVVAAPGHDAPPNAGWLVTQPGCVHREIFDRQIAADTPGLLIEAQAPTPDVLRRLARQGGGRALLPYLAVADDLAAGDLVADPAAPDPGGSMEIVAVFDADAPPAVHRFLRRAVDHALARAARPGAAGTG